MKTFLQGVITLFLLIILLSQTSCKKDEVSKKDTTVVVTVTNGAGVSQSNLTVYQINDNKYNLYGCDSFYKDQQSVTDTKGVATFEIDGIDFTTGGQRTYYFFCKYTIGGVNKIKSIGVTIKEGENKSVSLQLN